MRALGPVFRYAELPTTQEEARRLAAAGAGDGTVVVADRQTAGRGRRGRGWHSPPSGLWFSVLLRPTFSPQQASLLSTAAAVAVCRGLRQLGAGSAAIKWPNDVLTEGRKVAGILVELQTDEAGVRFAILGVGVNLNQQLEEFPEELRPTAISLRMALGRAVDRDEALEVLLGELAQTYGALHEDPRAVVDACRALSCTVGRWVVVEVGGERRLEGMAEAIDEDGSLLLRRAPDRALVRLVGGDVSLRHAGAAI